MLLYKKVLLPVSIVLCMIVLCLGIAAFGQFLPWSWPPANYFPYTGQIPLSNYPPPNYFPTIGGFQASNWPFYLPPIGTRTSPTPQAPASGACSSGLVLGVPIDQEFGPGASKITRCLVMNYGIKMLFHIDQFESRPGRAFGLHNIFAAIDDYVLTNSTNDFKIVAVVHSGGATLMLNRNAANPHPLAINNVYQPDVETLINKGVKFYL